MIIDCHTHCFSDKVAKHAMENLSKNSQYPPHYDGTLTGLKASMKEAGIDYSVVLNIATNAHQNIKVNDWAIEANRQDGIIAFGSIHPNFADYKQELNRLKQEGIKGIKFHPDYQDFFVDDIRMFPIYEYIASLGLVMSFHCGKDLVLREPLHCPPQRLANVVGTFSGAKIIGAHLGGQGLWDDVFEYIVGKDVYLDTSFAFKFMTTDEIKRFVEIHDNSKILFATDTPWQCQKVEVEEMRSFIKDKELLQKILYSNASYLLNI